MVKRFQRYSGGHRSACTRTHFSRLRRNVLRKWYQNQGNIKLILTSWKTDIAKSCLRTNMTKAPCRKRTGEAVLRAEKFGDLITADHKVFNEESRNNHWCAVMVQRLATQWIQPYPCKTKSSNETEKGSCGSLSQERFVDLSDRYAFILAFPAKFLSMTVLIRSRHSSLYGFVAHPCDASAAHPGQPPVCPWASMSADKT